MKYLDEYRDAQAVQDHAAAIRRIATRPWAIMEVCGGQTHSIVRFGLDELLPCEITLIHGPGCPVCVTPVELIDAAIQIAARAEVIFCSFGDMLRVPGTQTDLLAAKARGGDVRIVYSPLDALKIAVQNPDREVVFFAVGFETTAPANAMLAYQARQKGIKNVSLLVSHVLVPPALVAILSSKRNRVQGFLAPGHVCTIVGYSEYEALVDRFRVPMVVTGFEPLDILQGVLMCVQQLEQGRSVLENQYSRCVQRDGNPTAQRILNEVFDVTSRRWRGIGEIDASGLCLRGVYAAYDALKKFNIHANSDENPSECISGLVLQGLKKPHECPAFGTRCTPESPLGATMVSSEGACAAYYRYRPETARGSDAHR